MSGSRLNGIFHALSDPTRRAIVDRLSTGSGTVGELARPFAISAPAVSKHMRVLETAGLITRRIEGRKHHVNLAPRALAEAEEWISHYRDFWESRFDELERLLEESENDSEDRKETDR